MGRPCWPALALASSRTFSAYTFRSCKSARFGNGPEIMNSRSSRPICAPNRASRQFSSSAIFSESRTPVSNRSTSGEGISTCNSS